ncbi:hypothetical protein ADIS_3720 [Lunatimonas lonarensis]|uniref:Uncharacterized protein n=1 Tax=Lunatimonas lonarensis TaxID=1232681 RepID=R7ZP76_9BACT|nr:hypothetical protein ADIS_3720 [Lunatimonas lonarensis]
MITWSYFFLFTTVTVGCRTINDDQPDFSPGRYFQILS